MNVSRGIVSESNGTLVKNITLILITVTIKFLILEVVFDTYTGSTVVSTDINSAAISIKERGNGFKDIICTKSQLWTHVIA